MKKADEIFAVICQICNADPIIAKTKTRLYPYPYVRGLYWRALKMLCALTNRQIVKEQENCDWHPFSSATISTAMSSATKAASYDKAWRDIWAKISETLGIPKQTKVDNDVKIVISVPRGMRDSIKFDIVERRNI